MVITDRWQAAFRRRNQKLYRAALATPLIFGALVPARLQLEGKERLAQQSLHAQMAGDVLSGLPSAI
jgi:hypothetical protein